jgi:hypothetical protein
MFLQSFLPVWGLALLNAMLAALQVRPGAALTAALHVHLFTATSQQLTQNSTVAQFTEATFTGYAAVVLGTLSGPVNTPSKTATALFLNPSFVCSASGTPNVILGYWVDDGAGNFIMAESFASPVPIVNPGDFIDLGILFGSEFKVQM